MEIKLINVKKFILANQLREVTDPILLEKGTAPTAGGLLSTSIFGSSVKDRRDTCAYIDLKGQFLDPFVYKMLKRMNKNFESIVTGTKTFKITEEGLLVPDEDGETGLRFLYKNWNKIKFPRNNSNIRNERISMLEAYDRDTIFTQYWIVIPAFYRDINLQSAGTGKISHHEINDMYAKLIRQASILDADGFDFVLDATRASIQNTLVAIYDLLKSKIEKKEGLFRKSLLGKSIDYGSRSVISAPIFKAERPEDMAVDFYRSGIPLAQLCALFTPFVVSWVRRFFQREMESLGNRYPVQLKNGQIEYHTIVDADTYFNEEYIQKKIDRFVFSSGDRFDKIELPVEDKKLKGKIFLTFTGQLTSDPKSAIQRPATWTDILYQALHEITADKMVWITRYPLLDYFGMLPSRISVSSTQRTTPMFIGEKYYPHYPVVTVDMEPGQIGVEFLDTVTMSNLYLAGLGGDYDGDQVTVKGIFTQEANAEANEKLMSKAHILNVSGMNMRKTTNEGVQTLYMLTKTK